MRKKLYGAAKEAHERKLRKKPNKVDGYRLVHGCETTPRKAKKPRKSKKSGTKKSRFIPVLIV